MKNRKTIDSGLDGKIVTGEEKRYCSVLTAEEEIDIVEYVKKKNRAYQGINRGDLTKIIIDTLKIRKHLNKKGGRNFTGAAKKGWNIKGWFECQQYAEK